LGDLEGLAVLLELACTALLRLCIALQQTLLHQEWMSLVANQPSLWWSLSGWLSSPSQEMETLAEENYLMELITAGGAHN
jgi:hypothetical protein